LDGLHLISANANESLSHLHDHQARLDHGEVFSGSAPATRLRLTTIRTAGLSGQNDDVRKFGMSKEGVVARQVMLGVLQTAEGLPLYHEVFDGNTAEVTTLKGVIQRIVKQFTVQNRLARLEADGTILGYTVRLKPATEANRIRAVMMVAVEGNRASAVRNKRRGHPSVYALHSANGRWDIVAELPADTLEAFDRVLNAMRLIDGIATTETGIFLSTYKV
jgi:DNA-binding Lrp family transcriptional regulator